MIARGTASGGGFGVSPLVAVDPGRRRGGGGDVVAAVIARCTASGGGSGVRRRPTSTPDGDAVAMAISG